MTDLPNCTCHIHPCQCQDVELAVCPECGKSAPWPDDWEVGGMSIGIDEEGTITDDEDGDDGRVFCPNCGEIVVPIVATKQEAQQQTLFD